MTSHQIINNSIQSIRSNIDRARKIFSYLSENQLNWKPYSESWSVGECISHLVNSNSLYFKEIEKLLNSIQQGKEMDFEYHQSIAGKFIARGIDPQNVRRSKTFKVFLPDKSKISIGVLKDYVKSSERLINLAENMKHLDLKKVKLSSPVNKLIRLNLGDPLIIIPKHDERHLNQAERFMSHTNFPKV